MLFYIEKKKKKKIRIFKKSLLLQLKKFQIPFDSARSFREEDSFVRIYPRRYRGKRRGNFKPSSVSGVSIPLLKVNTRSVLKFHPRQNRIPERSGSRKGGEGKKERRRERKSGRPRERDEAIPPFESSWLRNSGLMAPHYDRVTLSQISVPAIWMGARWSRCPLCWGKEAK